MFRAYKSGTLRQSHPESIRKQRYMVAGVDSGGEQTKMNVESEKIRSGIVLFKGRISRNLLIEPMVSHTYFLEDGDEVIIFDPSCGKEIAKRIAAHTRNRLKTQVKWKTSSFHIWQQQGRGNNVSRGQYHPGVGLVKRG